MNNLEKYKNKNNTLKLKINNLSYLTINKLTLK
jgi:hypothetical protein